MPSNVRKSVGGLTSGTIGFDMTIGDLNEDQEIKAPASGAKPLAELSQALGGLLGGVGHGWDVVGLGQRIVLGVGRRILVGLRRRRPVARTWSACRRPGQDIAKVQDCAKHLE